MKWSPPKLRPGEWRNFVQLGAMVCIVDVAPEEISPVQLGSVEQVRGVVAVRMDGWLRLAFVSGLGGLGGIWCRVRVLELTGDVVSLNYSGWGPDCL